MLFYLTLFCFFPPEFCEFHMYLGWILALDIWCAFISPHP